ncbi:MAG: hypothetical protein H6738_20215 [Alphaproteobacteria bacterium]|nr:hypothetical protein [Alphaproteobacteria bacterium]
MEAARNRPSDDGGPRLPIGVVVLDAERRERVVELIPETARLPHVHRQRFAFAYPGMTAVRLEITVGRGERRDQVVSIGVVELVGVPPGQRGAALELVLDHRGDALFAALTDVDSGIRSTLEVHF